MRRTLVYGTATAVVALSLNGCLGQTHKATSEISVSDVTLDLGVADHANGVATNVSVKGEVVSVSPKEADSAAPEAKGQEVPKEAGQQPEEPAALGSSDPTVEQDPVEVVYGAPPEYELPIEGVYGAPPEYEEPIEDVYGPPPYFEEPIEDVYGTPTPAQDEDGSVTETGD